MDRFTEVYERMKGPVVPLNISFNEDGRVNFDAVRAYVDWLCAEGTRIVLLTSGSSEYASLSDEEIWQLTAEIADVNQGRSLFITSNGYWKPEQTRDFLAHSDSVGADAVKLQFHPGLAHEVVVRYVDLLEGAAGIPLLLLAGAPEQFPLSAAIELADRPYMIGMKNDGHPFSDYYDLIRGTQGKQFGVISGGQMRNFMFGYPLGSPGYLCPIAPFRPDIALEFYDHVAADRVDEAWQLVFRYEEPFMQWALNVNWLGVMKSAIQLQGLYPNNLLGHSFPPPAPDTLDQVRAMLEELFGASRTR